MGIVELQPPETRVELLETLAELCARLPVPDGGWHPHVAAIAACRDDFEHALTLAAADERTLDLLGSLLAGGREADFGPDCSPWLAGAWQRLAALPVPQGRHPFLDEIVPTLDALRLLLVALSRTEPS